MRTLEEARSEARGRALDERKFIIIRPYRCPECGQVTKYFSVVEPDDDGYFSDCDSWYFVTPDGEFVTREVAREKWKGAPEDL